MNHSKLTHTSYARWKDWKFFLCFPYSRPASNPSPVLFCAQQCLSDTQQVCCISTHPTGEGNFNLLLCRHSWCSQGLLLAWIHGFFSVPGSRSWGSQIYDRFYKPSCSLLDPSWDLYLLRTITFGIEYCEFRHLVKIVYSSFHCPLENIWIWCIKKSWVLFQWKCP